MMLQVNMMASFWPLLMGLMIYFNFMSILILIKYKFLGVLKFAELMMMIIFFLWTRDLMRESLYLGMYNIFMQNSFKIGMIFFILSEIMFFISIFWSYLHYMLMPIGDLGLSWPPKGLEMMNIFSVPLLNTNLLLSSGFTITLSHNYKMMGIKPKTNMFLLYTVMLGFVFTFFQIMEYYYMDFVLYNSVYGAMFYIGTGFHGLHVMVGTIMLMCLLVNMKEDYLNSKNSFFDLSSWYWHFVDVVWIILFGLFYWWVFKM